VYRNQVNDANQRAFYQRWAHLMAAETWAEVPKS
jgi:ethylbenzene dioxygenase alpha subunit